MVSMSGSRPPDLPRKLDRRFEAVIVWTSFDSSDPGLAPVLDALAMGGVAVEVIGPAAANGENGDRQTFDASPTRILQELWREGVSPVDVLILLNGLPGVARSFFDSAGFDSAGKLGVAPGEPTAAVVNARRAPLPTGVVSLAGGSRRLRQLLTDQLRRRRQGALPEVTQSQGWSLTIEGFSARHERVHGALLTLANGRMGTSGVSLAPNPSQHPWLVAAGVYDGDGPETHLLTGPRIFELSGLAGGKPLERVLDLHSGVLHERTRKEGRTWDSVRFVSLADATTSVLRVRSPKGSRAGAPLTPPSDDPVHDQGRSGGAVWMRVAASSGGIEAAAWQARTRGGTLDRRAAYTSDGYVLPEPTGAIQDLGPPGTDSFDKLLSDHRRAWADDGRTPTSSYRGTTTCSSPIRLAMFHLMASVADSGRRR